MRKATVLIVLAAFVVLAVAVPALAAQSSSTSKVVVADKPSQKGMVTLTCRVVYSNIEKPHYELLTMKSTMPVYVLTGPFDFGAYEGKIVRATGQVLKGYSIYMRGPILKVTEIKVAGSFSVR